MSALDLLLIQRNAGDTGFDERPVAPAANSLVGFSGSQLASTVTIGTGLTLAGGVLSGNTGTVTAVSVASANGFAGASSGGATPALTLSTTVNGLVKGDGTALSAATAGTDYSAGTSALGTGILKSTTGTGNLTIAVAGDFPTLNQNTTGSAAKWTTARNLAGNSVDGSANVAFANKFIVQGTTDAGLSAAQFLGALATGIVKNTTTTGVLSIAVAGDFPTLNQNTTGSASTLTTPRAIYGNNFDGSAALTQIIASTYGGTGNGFTKFTGPATSERTFTLPNSDATLLYSGGPLGTPSSGTVTNLTGTASININGTVGATTPNPGAFTTLSATGLISSSKTGQALALTGATTLNRRFDVGNTGQTMSIGVESSTGGSIVSGSTGYSSVLNTDANVPLYIGINSVIVAAFSATGLAVTGVISTTNPAGGAGPNWKLGAYTAGVASQAGKVRVEIAGTAYDLLTA